MTSLDEDRMLPTRLVCKRYSITDRPIDRWLGRGTPRAAVRSMGWVSGRKRVWVKGEGAHRGGHKSTEKRENKRRRPRRKWRGRLCLSGDGEGRGSTAP